MAEALHPSHGDPMIERIGRVLSPVPEAMSPLPIPEDLSDLIPSPLRAAAVLVPLVPSATGWEILLTRRTAHLRHHAGQIAFPGGGMEPIDRVPADTALRETWEEIGVQPESVSILGSLDPMPTITGFQVLPLVGIMPSGLEFVLDPNEVDDVFHVPLDFFLDPGNLQRQTARFQGRRRSFYVFQYQDYTIWGATAAMLVNLIERMNGD